MKLSTFHIDITGDNTPHLSIRVQLLFTRRNIEIRSMQATSTNGMRRMKLSIDETEENMKKLQKQLEKIIGIHSVELSTL